MTLQELRTPIDVQTDTKTTVQTEGRSDGQLERRVDIGLQAFIAGLSLPMSTAVFNASPSCVSDLMSEGCRRQCGQDV